MGLTSGDLILFALIVTPIVMVTFFIRRKRSVQRETAAQNSQTAIHFNWNGHSWEAHEVLGVSPASSMSDIQAAYQAQLTRSDSESMPFFEAAYQALVRGRSS